MCGCRAKDFFGNQPALNQAVGYAIVVGFGAPANIDHTCAFALPGVRRATPVLRAELQQTLQVYSSPSSRPSWSGRTTTLLEHAAAVSKWVLQQSPLLLCLQVYFLRELHVTDKEKANAFICVQFNTAGRTIRTGLIATDIVSHWCALTTGRLSHLRISLSHATPCALAEAAALHATYRVMCSMCSSSKAC